MENSLRLTYISNLTNEGLNQLWQSCFAGHANISHMNAHVPYPVTQQWQLNSFLINQNGYKVWLIKRNTFSRNWHVPTNQTIQSHFEHDS